MCMCVCVCVCVRSIYLFIHVCMCLLRAKLGKLSVGHGENPLSDILVVVGAVSPGGALWDREGRPAEELRRDIGSSWAGALCLVLLYDLLARVLKEALLALEAVSGARIEEPEGSCEAGLLCHRKAHGLYGVLLGGLHAGRSTRREAELIDLEG